MMNNMGNGHLVNGEVAADSGSNTTMKVSFRLTEMDQDQHGTTVKSLHHMLVDQLIITMHFS